MSERLIDKKRIRYGNCVIVPGAWEIRGNKGWAPKAQVEYHFGSGVTVTPLNSKKIFDNKDEAIKYSIIMARQWADEKYGRPVKS